MVLLVQVLGALFGVFMIYLMFINFKRREFSISEWAVWSIVAAAFAVLSLFPDLLNPVIRTLNISRKMDLLIIIGFMFLFAAAYYNYRISTKSQRKIEQVVRKVAIEEAGNKNKKRF